MPTDDDGPNMESAMLNSPVMRSTGASGKCLESVAARSSLMLGAVGHIGPCLFRVGIFCQIQFLS